ncbi:SPOR domain-containing protein [Niveispirillum sp. KHB5.9]|uniref:SPOR domain-containing protein n=1 Tax=Niveispirillum sp. KHB5.9 TaxID=3400269 RepID=UPI003A886E99
MTYYDDEDDNGPQNPPPPAGRQPPRADFRADPSFSPRAGYQPPQAPAPQDPYAQAPHLDQHPSAERHPMDDYVQPQRHAAPPPQAQSPVPDPEPHLDPAAAGYRAQAPSQDGYDPHYGYQQGHAAQQAQDAYYQDYEQQHQGYYQAPPPRRRNLLNIGIIAGAVVVFGGIIFYAYNQGMRAGTESVAPILRADTSPTKIRPDQPGGLEVPHQDKLVYDRLNPSGNTPPGEVERLLPPPETPMERPRAETVEPAEDMPMAEEGEGQVSAMREAPAEPAYQQPAPQPAPSYAPPVAPQQQPARTTTPPAQQPQQLLPQHQQSAPAAQKPVTQALVAPPPAALAPKPATPTPAPAAAVTAPPKPATGGAAVRVQVAAVDSEGKAAAEWQRLQRKFAGELGGLSMRTVRAELPKGIFYRIQGGPVDEARAKQICATMAAQGAGCSIVR